MPASLDFAIRMPSSLIDIKVASLNVMYPARTSLLLALRGQTNCARFCRLLD